MVETYTFHWQKPDGVFVRRWDNVKHHEEIPTFPYHVHDKDEGNVNQSEPMNYKKVLKIIHNEIEKSLGD